MTKMLEEHGFSKGKVATGGNSLRLTQLPSAPKEVSRPKFKRSETASLHNTTQHNTNAQAIKAFLREHFPTLKVPARDPVPTLQEVEALHQLKLAKGQPSDLAGTTMIDATTHHPSHNPPTPCCLIHTPNPKQRSSASARRSSPSTPRGGRRRSPTMTSSRPATC